MTEGNVEWEDEEKNRGRFVERPGGLYKYFTPANPPATDKFGFAEGTDPYFVDAKNYYTMNIDLQSVLGELTPKQLEILHKLTTWKYDPKKEGLITLDEYQLLPDFLKGYAHYLQADWSESTIPKEAIDNDAFKKGEHWAMTEVTELQD